MADGILTQEEIDALLSGAALDGGGGGSPAPAASPAGVSPHPSVKVAAGNLGGEELKALGERLKVGFGAAADATSTLLGRRLTLSPISLDTEDDAAIAAMIGPFCAVFDFALSGAASGAAAVAMPTHDAALLADLLMGGDGSNPPADLGDLHQNAAKEVVTPIVNGLVSSLSRELGSTLTAGTIFVRTDNQPPLAGRGSRVFGQYSFEVEGLRSGMFFLCLDNSVARAIAGTQAAPAPRPTPQASAAATAAAPAPRGVGVQSVAFPSLAPTLTENQAKNIELLADVPMQVTVELGRRTMMIRDVLELGTGSIIELDKLAGEPVDLLVNQKLIARGEVVVIDESFGVRVTDIVSPIERIKGLQ